MTLDETGCLKFPGEGPIKQVKMSERGSHCILGLSAVQKTLN